MGILYSSGYNGAGGLGLGDWINRTTHEQIGTAENWTQASAGRLHSAAINSLGELYVWGHNYYGQLGLGDTDDRNSPTQVGTDSDWEYVECAYNDTYAIKSDGTLWATGKNSMGQLGLGDTNGRNEFVQVGTDSDWSKVFGGIWKAFALKTNGTLYGCGINVSNQLGICDGVNKTTFTQVGTDSDWEKAACPNDCSFFLKENGELYVCGRNNYEEAPTGYYPGYDLPDTICPAERIDSNTWVDIKGSEWHMFGIRDDGALYAWGDNLTGMLGLGSEQDWFNFPTLTGSGSWTDIDTGFSSMGIESGDVFGTGENEDGDLGLGHTNIVYTWQDIGIKAIEVAVGTWHTLIMAQWGPPSTPSGIDTLGGSDVYITAVKISDGNSWASCMPSFLMSGVSTAYGWKIHEGAVGKYFPLNVGNLNAYLYGNVLLHVTSGTTWESSTIHTLASGEEFVDMQEVDTDTYHLAKYGGTQGAIYKLTETMSEYVGTAFQPSSLYVVYDYEVNDFIGASGSQSGPIRRYNPTDGWAEQTGIPETAITDIDGSYW